MQQLSEKSILLTALNWGIGHAARCVPLIQAIISEGANLTIASDGKAKAFLQKEFPTLDILEMPTNEIRYGKRGVAAALLPQLPAFFKQINADQKWVQDLVSRKGIDLIISDNRYGCYHDQVPSVLITHQLNIQAPKLAKPMIDKVLRSWVNNFNEIWVPDVESGLAGILTDNNLDIPVRFLGPLSRFENNTSKKKVETLENQLLVLLSGPEPQRSILEEKIWSQLEKINIPVVFVRGTNTVFEQTDLSHVDVFDLLTANDLKPFLEKSKYIICRSGYSTLMDLAQFSCQALLIPTPGQSEQEYLAKYCEAKNWSVNQPQHKFNIDKFIKLDHNQCFPKIPTTIKRWIYQIIQLSNF